MLCENCNKEIDGSYASGRFCSRSCASGKGKTVEEIYGKEKANWRLSLKTGKSYEELYGKEKAEEIKLKIGKGKTAEERYGKEKAEELSKLKKGKTAEERYGKERAAQLCKWPKEKIKKTLIKIINKIGPIKKIDIKTLHHTFNFCTETTIRNKWKNLDELSNEIQIKWKKPKKRIGHKRIGLNETKLLNSIEATSNIIIERQYPVYINNSYKFIDGYDSVNKVAYEIDEPHHKSRLVEDFIREREIKEKLKCEFIRIKDRW